MNGIKLVAKHAVLPAAVIAVFFSALHYRSVLPGLFWDIMPILFYLLSVMAVAVSWHFNRSRFIFILLPLVPLFWALTNLETARLETLLLLTSLLIPLHLFLFLVLKERGLFSLWGLLKILFVVVEVAAVVYLSFFTTLDVGSVLNISIFNQTISGWTPLGDTALVLGLFMAFLFGLFAFLHHQVIYHTAFIGMLFLSLAGLHHTGSDGLVSLAFLGVVLTVLGVLVKESYRLAFYDELTGLPGRRALIENMAKLGRKYSLAMVDIDHFKKFNDTYGHDTGDDVLKMVAAKLSSVGGGGTAYRYGGEEFTILFPSKTVADAYAQMDTLRKQIAESAFVVRSSGKKGKSKTVNIYISSGVVEKSAKDKDPFAVMKRADNALYKAKKKGRNIVVKG